MNHSHIRTNEGGSLVTFVVIGLVLAALVVGGVYTVQKKERQESPSSKPSPSVSVSKAPSDSKAPVTTQPKLSEKPKATKSPVAPSRTPSAKAPKQGDLPATGPSEDIVSILMLAGLVGTAVAYVRSRNVQRFAYQVD